MKNNKKNTCDIKLNCKGVCHINNSGDFGIWKIISNKCGGSKKEKKLIEEAFVDGNKKINFINNYNFDEKEKEILSGDWY